MGGLQESMKYFVAVSEFHKKVYESIFKDESAHFLFVVKKEKSWRNILRNFALGFGLFLIAYFDRRSHVYIPHPWGPWFSLMVLASKEISIYDDGIAYYNNTELPNSLLAKLYFHLSKKLSKYKLWKDVLGSGYRDYLSSSNISCYYSIFPEYFKDLGTVCICPIAFDKVGAENFESEISCIYVDSTSSVANLAGVDRVVSLLERISEKGVKVYFKAHPAERSLISTTLEKMSWAEEINEGLELFFSKVKVERMYCLYSSSMITLRVMQPEAKIYCFEVDEADISADLLLLMNRLNVDFICG